MDKKRIVKAIGIALVIIPMVLIFSRLLNSSQDVSGFIPKDQLEVTMTYNIRGNSSFKNIKLASPQTTIGQTITNKRIEASNPTTIPDINSDNSVIKLAVGKGLESVKQAFVFEGKKVAFELDPKLIKETVYPTAIKQYTKSSFEIESDSEEFSVLNELIVAPQASLDEKIRGWYNYVVKIERLEEDETMTAYDAMLSSRLSNNGKCKLFTGLLRSADVPARIVAGIDVEDNSSPKFHEWVELYVSGQWIPFDFKNQYFAFKAAHHIAMQNGNNYNRYELRNVIENNTTIEKTSYKAAKMSIGKINNIAGIQPFQFGLISKSIIEFILLFPVSVLLFVVFRKVLELKGGFTYLPILIAFSVYQMRIQDVVILLVASAVLTVLIRSMFNGLDKKTLLWIAQPLSFIVVIAFLIAISWGEFEKLLGLNIIALLSIYGVLNALMHHHIAQGTESMSRLLFRSTVVAWPCYAVLVSGAFHILTTNFPELLVGLFGILLLRYHKTILSLVDGWFLQSNGETHLKYITFNYGRRLIS